MSGGLTSACNGGLRRVTVRPVRAMRLSCVWRRYLVIAGAVQVTACSSGHGTRGGQVLNLRAVDSTLLWLESAVGTYPPHFDRVHPENETRARLDSLAKALEAHAGRAPESDAIEWRLGELYRMAFNADVPGAVAASESHLHRALALDSACLMAHLVIGGLYLTADTSLDSLAESHFQRALSLPPDSAATAFHALELANRGLFELALRARDIPRAILFGKTVLSYAPGDSAFQNLVAELERNPMGWSIQKRLLPGSL